MNKAALITGGAKRIGQAISLDLARLGYDIALHFHTSQEEAQVTVNTIREIGVSCALFRCDLSKEEQALKLIGQVKRKFPNLEVLVNSASVFEKSKLTIKDLKLLNYHFAIHLKAPFILTCEFTRLCNHGQIINILDTNIAKNKTSHIAYLLSKKSLENLTKLSAIELAPNIRVNAIAPGLILPPGRQTAAYLDRLATQIPLEQKGDVLSITQTLRFLIENKFITGQVIYTDGGENLI